MAETVRVDFSELMAVADEMTANARDLPRVMSLVAESLVSHVQATFKAEGAVGGRPKWQDLADSTKRKRAGGEKKKAARLRRQRAAGARRLNAGKKLTKAQARAFEGRGTFVILQDRGTLAGSIMPDTGDIYAEAYTNVPYAVFHVSPEPRTLIPLRDFFAVDEKSFAADSTEMILEALVKRRR